MTCCPCLDAALRVRGIPTPPPTDPIRKISCSTLCNTVCHKKKPSSFVGKKCLVVSVLSLIVCGGILFLALKHKELKKHIFAVLKEETHDQLDTYDRSEHPNLRGAGKKDADESDEDATGERRDPNPASK